MTKPISPKQINKKGRVSESVLREVNVNLKTYFELSNTDCCTISLDSLERKIGIDFYSNLLMVDNITKLYREEGWDVCYRHEVSGEISFEFRIPPQEE